MFKFTVMTLAPTAVLGAGNIAHTNASGSAGLSASAADRNIDDMLTGSSKASSEGYKICDDFEDRKVQLVPLEGIPKEGELKNENEGVDVFTLKADTAALSQLVKTMIDEEEADQEQIPLTNVKTEIMKKVVEFLKHYETQPMTPIEKPLKSSNMSEVLPEDEAWFAKFVDDQTQEDLFELILAANYMDIKPLLDLTCAKVASMIKGKTPDQIKETFNVVKPENGEEQNGGAAEEN